METPRVCMSLRNWRRKTYTNSICSPRHISMKSANNPQLSTQVKMPPVVRRRRWVSLSTVHSVGSNLAGLAGKRGFFLTRAFLGARMLEQDASFFRSHRAFCLEPLAFAAFLLRWSVFCGKSPLSKVRSKSFRTSWRGRSNSTTCEASEGSLHCTTYMISRPWPSASSRSSVPSTESWSAMRWSCSGKWRHAEQCWCFACAKLVQPEANSTPRSGKDTVPSVPVMASEGRRAELQYLQISRKLYEKNGYA